MSYNVILHEGLVREPSYWNPRRTLKLVKNLVIKVCARYGTLEEI